MLNTQVDLQKFDLPDDSDIYFKSRPRKSQMGAWLSSQSSSIDFDYSFNESLNQLESKFKGREVDRPLYWGGYCVIAERIEFWQGRRSRLHDRLLYEFSKGNWCKKRLSP